MAQIPPIPDFPRHDVRMDGVYFCRVGAEEPFVRALDADNCAYCLMVRSGRLRLESDFPVSMAVDLEAGDCVAVSGLAPQVFRSLDAPPDAEISPFERHPLGDGQAPRQVDLILGVAPSESLALGSLMTGPIIVRPREHPELSRRLWAAVAMLEDEYAEATLIDRELVIRRLAEIMLVNLLRRIFAVRTAAGEGTDVAPASRPVMLAIEAFLRAPHRAWTLPDLARAAGVSRTRFAEEFKQITGHTPARIVARLRLTATARRLASEALSVAAAAEDAGYSSAAAFVRAFQREFGQTPARWRRQRPASAAARPPIVRQPARTRSS